MTDKSRTRGKTLAYTVTHFRRKSKASAVTRTLALLTYSRRKVGWIHNANFQASVAPEMENLGLVKVNVSLISTFLLGSLPSH